MDSYSRERHTTQEPGRPYRIAEYGNPEIGSPFPVSAERAATIRAETPSAQFYVDGCRVYPKPTVGIFAKWPGETLRVGETAPETELHLAAKRAFAQILRKGKPFTIQPVRRRSGEPSGMPFQVRPKAWRIEAPIRVKRARSNLTPDALILTHGGMTGHWVGMEFRNTHAVDYRKRYKLQRLPMTNFEVDVREFAKSFWPGDTLETALVEWFQSGIPARIITLVGELECRPVDDPILQRAILGSS